MPIEFACTNCQTMLRVPDEAAGKHAKCPRCGQFMLTPDPAAAPSSGRSQDESDPVLDELSQIDSDAESPQPFSQSPPQSFDAPPAASPPPDSPFEQQPSAWPQSTPPQSPPGPPVLGSNPFSDSTPPTHPNVAPGWQPAAPAPIRVADVRAKVMGPAIGLIVISVLSLLYVAFATLMQVIEGMNDMNDTDQIIGAILVVGVSSFWSLLVLIGAIQMMRMRRIYLAWTASIVGILPCSCCFVLSIPFGIWGVVVLSDPQVQKAFELNRA